MTYHEFFMLAERIEDLSRSLYLVLAEDVATPRGVRELFLGLAAEEQEHGRRLQLLSASQRGTSWGNQVVGLAAAGVRVAAREFEAFLAEVKAERRPGDLLAILDRLVRMEQRLSFVHAEELARGAGPEVARLFEAMAKQDRRHQKLLQRVRQQQPAMRA